METKKVISNDKATIIIQMSPQAKDSVIYVDGQETLKHTAVFKGFFKTQPKALGIVQIMIGVTVFLIGVLFTFDAYRLYIPEIFVIITYLGSFIYIIAGSLSVTAQNKVNWCLVKASLGMNVFSAITAGVTIILLSPYFVASLLDHQGIYEVQKSCLRNVGIMLLFTIPQFIISICISALACKATCNIHPTVVNVALNQMKEGLTGLK